MSRLEREESKSVPSAEFSTPSATGTTSFFTFEYSPETRQGKGNAKVVIDENVELSEIFEGISSLEKNIFQAKHSEISSREEKESDSPAKAQPLHFSPSVGPTFSQTGESQQKARHQVESYSVGARFTTSASSSASHSISPSVPPENLVTTDTFHSCLS